MTDKLFNRLWQDALVQPNEELYIGEYGYPDWFDDISTDAAVVVETLQKIHHAAHMTIDELVKESGSIGNLCNKFCVPRSTVCGWLYENKKCPDYVRLAFARGLGLI